MNRPMKAALLCALLGCGPPSAAGGDLAPGDGFRPDTPPDGGVHGLFVAVTFSGCVSLELLEKGPLCTGDAPLTLDLIGIVEGASESRWQVAVEDDPDGGNGTHFELDTEDAPPRLKLLRPGRYTVTLAIRGAGGTAAASGAVLVRAAPLGSSCEEGFQCQKGLECVCGKRDGGCPAALSLGMCTMVCDGAPCPVGSVCADLSRGVAGAGAAWRRPLCVPSCKTESDCRSRPGLDCRELPLLTAGASRGGPYAWGLGCFIREPLAVGGECALPTGEPDPSACLGGMCEPLGARNLCSAPCDPPCPASAACAEWNGPAPAPGAPRCLPRCDDARPCTDPLLACQAGGGSGSLGFRLPGEPAATRVCAPRRCSAPAECRPGVCKALGAASFCLRQ